MAKRRKGKRVSVKGHYRVIVRDALGRIISSKKWSPKRGEGGEIVGKSRHNRIADRIASKFGSTHLREGVDIRVKDMAIEVATTSSDVYQSISQLNRSRKRRKFLSVPKEFRETALRLTKGTGIGVMDGTGRIIKRTRRKKR